MPGFIASTEPWMMTPAGYGGHGRAQMIDPSVKPPEAGEDDAVGPEGPEQQEVAPAVVRRAVEGDDGAFATFIEHYDPSLRALAFHVLGDRDGMDDVLQTTYLKAYRALPRLTADTRPGPWLYQIAYFACLDELRRRQRRPNRPVAPDESEPPATGRAGDGAAEPSAFDRALASLPADQRTAVLLVDRAGLDLAAVAEVLGHPETVAAKVLARARGVLHAALDGEIVLEDVHSEELDRS